MSPRNGIRSKGFLNSVNRRKYFLGLVLTNLLFLAILYLLDELWMFLGILGVELCLIGFIIGSIVVVIYSADTWFEFIA